MFDFLTPQIFNMLVIANLIVGLILIIYRFNADMTRPIHPPEQQRQQTYDEASTSALEATASPDSQAVDSSETPAQGKQQS
jgi:hypothetical protein